MTMIPKQQECEIVVGGGAMPPFAVSYAKRELTEEDREAVRSEIARLVGSALSRPIVGEKKVQGLRKVQGSRDEEQSSVGSSQSPDEEINEEGTAEEGSREKVQGVKEQGEEVASS